LSKAGYRFTANCSLSLIPQPSLTCWHVVGAVNGSSMLTPPFGGPAQVLEYLGRYTHKVAITHHRVRNLEAGNISCR
jgi:hypothetical protein